MSAQGQPYGAWYTRDVLAGEIDEDPTDAVEELAGMREGVRAIVIAWTSHTKPSAPDRDQIVDAIMAEIARRL